MLRIYCADGRTDGEKFIFDQIDPGRRTLLLVPDQFSLQAEQDALQYCGQAKAGEVRAAEPDAGPAKEGEARTAEPDAGPVKAGEARAAEPDAGREPEPQSEAALLNLMVTDFSALGHKVVKETDGHDPQIIDKYGRHMLLSVLIERLEEKLVVLRCRSGRHDGNALAEQMNTMISELKRYEISPEKLAEVIEQLKRDDGSFAKRTAPADERDLNAGEDGRGIPPQGPGNYLVLKLEDMLQIYQAYEEAVADVYQDAEDYITYYADRIPRASLVKGSDVWIYGFDTFTPKNLLVIRRLLETAENVSVVMTYEEDDAHKAAAGEAAGGRKGGADFELPDAAKTVRSLTRGGGAGLFRLTEQVMQKLEHVAEEAGREHCRQRITGYRRQSIWERGDAPEMLRDRIRLVQTSGTFEEAESAAAYIQTLTRDEGYRYGEIAVLCNDVDGRGRQLLRAFDRWDIPAFADQKRRVLHQPVVSFLLSFLEVLVEGFRGDGIIGMIKSGLLGWSMDDEALLENYITEFRIRGSRWQKEFTWDGGVYSEDELRRLNEMRAFLVSVCVRAKDAIGRRNTAEEKVRGLVFFLRDEFCILDRIEDAVKRQRQLLLMEGAAETAQIWNAICGIFEQIVQVIGQERISNELLRDMICAGLETLEIGLVPASGDCVLLGTLQRSRPGRIRALVVTGANAGLLPLDAGEEGLLSRREKERLEAMDLEFAGRQRIAQMEEQIAIYRMFSLPSEQLYVSCSQSADDGSMLRPSDIFQRLAQWQPAIAGNLSDRDWAARIGCRKATVPYLAEALRAKGAGGTEETKCDAGEMPGAISSGELHGAGQIDPWMEVLRWYEENDPQLADRLMRGARFNNHREALGAELADALYRGDRQALEVSASRLELFSGCPFSHFIQYGLRARERRLFEVGGREIGDIYHRCMMEFSRGLEAAGDAPAATWQTITEEQCRERVARILQGNTEEYREGLFSSDESNRFRMDRITEICGDIAWALVNQVRSSRVRRMYFEQPFGFAGTPAAENTHLSLPAIEVDVAGRKVRIRGIIDRLDVMDAGEGQPAAVRVVDYKTGSNTIRVEDFQSGYKLQLMVYMDAALQAGCGPAAQGTASVDSRQPPAQLQPAGVFYFKIRDCQIDGDLPAGVPDPADPADLQHRMEKFYRMEGVVVNDAALIGAMDARVEGGDKAESMVIPVKYDPKKECYVKTGGGTLLEQETFRQLLEETNRQVERICDELYAGKIAAIPKRESRADAEGNRITACRYCDFRSICGFDPSLRGCRYEDV